MTRSTLQDHDVEGERHCLSMKTLQMRVAISQAFEVSFPVIGRA